MKNHKKLVVRRETLRALSRRELAIVAGGGLLAAPPVPQSCNGCASQIVCEGSARTKV